MGNIINKNNPILVWRFEFAPEELKQLSQHGGDEDWLVEIPPEILKDKNGNIIWIYWLESSAMGCDYSKHNHPTKEDWVIYIYCH